MKFYKRISRFHFRRFVSKRFEKHMRWLLSLKPGMLINPCTGFNETLISIEPEIRQTKRGWMIIDYTITTNKVSCSLAHCGVEPELPRQIIEERHLAYFKGCLGLYSMGQNWFEHWYSDVEQANAHTKHAEKIIARLESGKHICDDQGRLLDEWLFQWKSDSDNHKTSM